MLWTFLSTVSACQTGPPLSRLWTPCQGMFNTCILEEIRSRPLLRTHCCKHLVLRRYLWALLSILLHEMLGWTAGHSGQGASNSKRMVLLCRTPGTMLALGQLLLLQVAVAGFIVYNLRTMMMMPDICIGQMRINDEHIQLKELKAGMVRRFGTCVDPSSATSRS